MDGVAAPTLITQEAANNLSRRVNLVLGRRRGDLVCPGEWSQTLCVSFFMVCC